MSVNKRLKEYIKSQKMTISHYEKEISVSNGYVNSISKGIGGEVLLNILEKSPNLNLVWLLTGEGEMLKETFNLKPTTYLHDNEDEKKDDRDYMIEVQKKLIEKLEKEVKELKEQLENKTKV